MNLPKKITFTAKEDGVVRIFGKNEVIPIKKGETITFDPPTFEPIKNPPKPA